MANNRHKFTKTTRDTLRDRAGNACSFFDPECGRPTSGPSAEAIDATSDVGEACHIRGGRPGSRRYDDSMTNAERSSIENGIWMCRNHGKLIDSDEATYTVELLHQWNGNAEERAKRGGGGEPAAVAVIATQLVESRAGEFSAREAEYQDQIKALTQVVQDLTRRRDEPDAPAGIAEALEQLAAGETAAAESIFSEILGRKSSEVAAEPGGGIYQIRGDLDQAEAMYRKALTIDEELGRKEGMANAYGNLGLIYQIRGDLDQAREYWERSRALYAAIGMPHMVERLDGWLADTQPPIL